MLNKGWGDRKKTTREKAESAHLARVATERLVSAAIRKMAYAKDLTTLAATQADSVGRAASMADRQSVREAVSREAREAASQCRTALIAGKETARLAKQAADCEMKEAEGWTAWASKNAMEDKNDGNATR